MNIWLVHELDLEILQDECVCFGVDVEEEDNIAHVALDLEIVVATPEDSDAPIADRCEAIEVLPFGSDYIPVMNLIELVHMF